jgi:GNAT superfamily N-acetyltransferase
MTALHLATAEDFDRLVPMAITCHEVRGQALDSGRLRAALLPLLEGSPHGMVYLIGPRAAPVGYIALGTGWSVAMGGLECRIEDFWIRDRIRGRGVGSEVLAALGQELGRHGLACLTVTFPTADQSAERLFARSGFRRIEGTAVMTQRLRRP